MIDLKNGVRHLFLAIILALALINVTSCDLFDGYLEEGQGNEWDNDQGDEWDNDEGDEQDNNQGDQGNATPTYDNFNRADYVIINETDKPDSELASLKDILWLVYAEKEYVGDWMANYIKTNKIKTILSSKGTIGGGAWIDPDYLDRIYWSAEMLGQKVGFFKENNNIAGLREDLFVNLTHETMHLVQHKSNVFELMKGMRPDICAAAYMWVEYLPWFYTETRYPGTYVTADMENAVAMQSKYMILSADPWAYDDACAKDPSLPGYIHSTPWFNNNLNLYAQQAFGSQYVRENALTAPLYQASKEDMLRVARAILACRDPKMAGVTDEAIWTVFDALRRASTGDSKYLRLVDDYSGWYGANREMFNNFQDIIAEWDADYAAQRR